MYFTITFPTGLFSNANYIMVGSAAYNDSGNGASPALVVVSRGGSTKNTYYNKTSTSISIVISDNSTDNLAYNSYDCNLVFFGF